MTTEQWLMLGGLLTTWIAAAISIYNARASKRNMEAQTEHELASTTNEDARASESYANASRLVADELVAVRVQMAKMNSVLDERDKLIVQLTSDNADLKDWAERLVHQLQSHSLVPVPFRSLSSHTQPRK